MLPKPLGCGHSSKEGPGQGHFLNKQRNSPINHLILVCLLGPASTGTGTIALDPAFGSLTLLEPVSHQVNQFLW